MPRKIVPIIEGEIYHVFNRGVDKRTVFLDTDDYLRFYQSLYLFNTVEPVINFMTARSQDTTQRDSLVEIHAYSLLPNHFHMLVKSCADGSLSEFMKRVIGGYTSHFNEKYERTGSLFQGTFKRVHVDSDEQYQYLFSYVNENHFVHGIERVNQIMYSSSLHFQRAAQSRVISIVRPYNANEHQALAREIHTKRMLARVFD
jgi:putative transposase